jgi:hypothetical protein
LTKSALLERFKVLPFWAMFIFKSLTLNFLRSFSSCSFISALCFSFLPVI